MTIAGRIATLDWTALREQLHSHGHALTETLLPARACRALAALYDDDARFRSTVRMASHGFGQGEYRYFAYPLPPVVQTLRESLYPPLAAIANAWAERLGDDAHWPATLDAALARCRAARQARPTPLLLRYEAGDYNCLHQDVYGALHFPLQAILLLDAPGADFDGGELVLVEQRPRMQSKATVLPLVQGALALIPVRERPRQGTRGVHRVQVRHGVSLIRRGRRRTLGLIFHDAA